MQLWGWGEVKKAGGWAVHRVQYHRGEDVIGAAQILVKKLPWPLRSFAYIPRGPVVDIYNREELLKELADYTKHSLHSVVLSIEPDSEEYITPSGWHKSTNKVLPFETVVLDLTKSESDLMADMAKKTRQYIRKSSGETIEIKMIRSREELDKCLNLYHATAKRAGFDLHPDKYYHDVFDKMADHCQVFASYVTGEPIAFLWLAISQDVAFELYGGTDEHGQELRANYALKWHAIQKCKEWGLTRYDFGGLIEGGVSTFKLGWTADKTHLAGTFDKPLSPAYILWSRGLPAAKSIIRKVKKLIKR